MNSDGIIRTFFALVLLTAATVKTSKIYEQRTDYETTKILGMIRDELSDSDKPSMMNSQHKRSTQDLPKDLTALGKNISEYLYSSDGQLFGADTPVWLALTHPNRTIEYRKMRKGIVGMVVSKFYNGHFPPATKEEQEDSKNETFSQNSEAPNTNGTILDAHYNVTVNSTSVTEEEMKRLESEISKASRCDNRTDASRIKRSYRETIYPSLLIQTDLNNWKTTLNDLDYYDEIIYQLAFWTAVDLRFRQLNYPKIRIRIAGIIIALDRSATPYLRSADTTKIWNETREFWWNMGEREDFPHTAYHFVMTMTDRPFFSFENFGNGITTQSFCRPPSDKKLYSVGIVRDKGGFEGILKATRILGNLFGLADAQNSGDECHSSNGFLMHSQYATGPNNLKWSSCSLKELSWSLSRIFMSCYDKPAEFHPPGLPLSVVLPGTLATRDEQCRGRGYNWACNSNPDICGQLECYHTGVKVMTNGWWCQSTGPAVEGTKCAPGHLCMNGVCQCFTDECLYPN